MKHLKKILLPLVAIISCNANAAFILNDDINKVVNPFNLTESFKNFYGYATSVRASSNTGFEEVDSAIFMLTEFQDQFSLIATFGAFVADGDLAGGELRLEMTNNGNGLADFVFIDDPTDPEATNGNQTTIDFAYIRDRTDGFILDLGDGKDVDLSFLMTQLVGLNNFKFLNAGGGDYVIDSQFDLSLLKSSSVAEPIPEPNGIFVLAMSAVIAFSLRKKYSKRQ